MFAKDPARWVFYDEVLIHKNNLKGATASTLPSACPDRGTCPE
jgi:hypothetical protein